MTTPATGRPRPGSTNSPPPRPGPSVSAAVRWRTNEQCAGRAVEAGEEYGVWAGIKLPGGQYRKRHQLARAHDVLRNIADGVINPRELPESVDLLSRGEDIAVQQSTVVHLPWGGRVSAA